MNFENTETVIAELSLRAQRNFRPVLQIFHPIWIFLGTGDVHKNLQIAYMFRKIDTLEVTLW